MDGQDCMFDLIVCTLGLSEKKNSIILFTFLPYQLQNYNLLFILQVFSHWQGILILHWLFS